MPNDYDIAHHQLSNLSSLKRAVMTDHEKRNWIEGFVAGLHFQRHAQQRVEGGHK